MDSSTSIMEALDEYEGRGFHGRFRVRSSGAVRCFQCGNEYAAHEITMEEASRIEGVSDPAAEAVVAALRCKCGARGTTVFTYGPGADPREADALGAILDGRPGRATAIH